MKTKCFVVISLNCLLLFSTTTVYPAIAFQAANQDYIHTLDQEFSRILGTDSYKALESFVQEYAQDHYLYMKNRLTQLLDAELTGVCTFMVELCAQISAYLMYFFGQPLGSLLSYPITFVIAIPTVSVWALFYGAILSVLPVLTFIDECQKAVDNSNNDWFALFGMFGFLLVLVVLLPVAIVLFGCSVVVAFPICTVLSFIDIWLDFMNDYEILRWKAYSFLVGD